MSRQKSQQGSSHKKSHRKINPRLAAIQVLQSILPIETKTGQSLSKALPKALDTVDAKDKGLLSSICYGVLRFYPSLEAKVNKHLEKPLRNKDRDIHLLLLCACFQLEHTRVPDHAVISESVELALILKKKWAKGFINAVLRNIQRDLQAEEENPSLENNQEANPEALFNHPQWMIKTIKHDWPEHWQNILYNNNKQGPLSLRVNHQQSTTENYLKLLQELNLSARTSSSPNCITLDSAVDVLTLPYFLEGWVSVQDEAAQQAAPLLKLEPGQKVLDACSAPGGKAGHILESEPSCQLTCIDIDAIRLQKIEDNLTRLGLCATSLAADVQQLDLWWDGHAFDRILLDAPCSASGIIRRHPDIKWLRRQEDIPRLAELQLKILSTLWSTLKPGGILLYATCSIFKQENEEVITAFLSKQGDAEHDDLDCKLGQARPKGQQLLPQVDAHDGFYYARLKKIVDKC